MKAVYQAIRSRIESELTAIKWVRIWNNQLQNLEDGQQIPFLFPAVFVEFLDVQYTQLGGGIQNGLCRLRLHILDEFWNGDDQEENLQVFDVKDSVYKLLNNWKSETAQTSPFLRTSEEQDTSHSNLYHFIQDYEVRFNDIAAQTPVNGVDATIDTITLIKAIEITNDTIKTAGDF